MKIAIVTGAAGLIGSAAVNMANEMNLVSLRFSLLRPNCASITHQGGIT
jgi:nucleoside-diphosphate-sugar epimerase